MTDLAAIRRAVERGDQTPPTTVVALCDQLEENRREMGEFAYLAECDRIEVEHARATLREIARHTAPVTIEAWDAQRIDRYIRERFDQGIPLADKRLLNGAVDAPMRKQLLEVLRAARAYFNAVDRCDGIVAAEQALREALAECGS